jgi:hypothetical protein
MLSSIQVKQRDPREKMFPASRINFGKLYTVEHNVKVYDFGDVRRSSLSALVKQWKWVFDNNLQGNAPESNPDRDDNGGGEDEEEDDPEAGPPDDEVELEVVLPINGKALWPWTANVHGQLEFRAGDIITITDWADENWGRGKNLRTGKKGLFARNYVSTDS